MEALMVEHDEDLELVTGQRHIYAQIKTRTGTLLAGELDGFFTRARDLAAAHANGTTPGSAEFWLVTNAEVSGSLASRRLPRTLRSGLRIPSLATSRFSRRRMSTCPRALRGARKRPRRSPAHGSAGSLPSG
jgi:hypothetical protein